MKKLSLATKILIGLVLGIIVGLLFTKNPQFVTTYIKPFGTIFINLIKMVVVPVVLFSIISGVLALKDIRKVGSIGVKTMGFYMVTTAMAVILGLVLANVIDIAGGAMFDTSGLQYEAKEAPKFVDTLINIFPASLFKPLVEANMLQVIVIAILFGFGIILAGEKGQIAADIAESMNEVSMKVMGMIISLSPYGVFALMAPVVAENGPSIIGKLLRLILVCYLGYILQAGVVYSTMLRVVGNFSPIRFFKGLAPAMMMAFSSASSNATLPLNIECTEKMGVKKEVAAFVLPLGATINMDGTAIYQGISAVFIASVFGVDLTIGQMATIVLTATLASIGTAGVPGAGMIMLAMVLESVGLPVEGIALIMGIDRIVDMGRTTVNITGDSACAICVNNLEEKKEQKRQLKQAT